MSPAPRRTDPAEGHAALVRWWAEGQDAAPATVRTAVRYTLEELAAAHPGHAVEVRVPPYAAVQCVAGPRHTRGTPPNVVEMRPATWLRLAAGRTTWDQAVAGHEIQASGSRSDLSGLLPLFSPRALDRTART